MGMSSMLAEATAVISALVAVVQWLDHIPKQGYKVWIWSDSLSTLVKVPVGEAQYNMAGVEDKLLVWVSWAESKVAVEWGWVQA